MPHICGTFFGVVIGWCAQRFFISLIPLVFYYIRAQIITWHDWRMYKHAILHNNKGKNMKRSEFNALCAKHCVDPNLALEDLDIVGAIKIANTYPPCMREDAIALVDDALAGAF